jgi:hypothetical protein
MSWPETPATVSAAPKAARPAAKAPSGGAVTVSCARLSRSWGALRLVAGPFHTTLPVLTAEA